MTAHDIPNVQPDISDPAPPVSVPAPESDEPCVRVAIDIPASLAVRLKHRTHGQLDIAETAALIVQLYADAPLEPGSATRTLTTQQHARICETLGVSPQTLDELVSAIESLVAVSFGGIRLKLTAEEVDVINARNATGLPPREWAEMIWRVMFDAWRNGVIG